MAEYMGTSKAAELWGYTQATIRLWCNDPVLRDKMGAEQDGVGKPWRIPIDAKCPKPIKKK